MSTKTLLNFWEGLFRRLFTFFFARIFQAHPIVRFTSHHSYTFSHVLICCWFRIRTSVGWNQHIQIFQFVLHWPFFYGSKLLLHSNGDFPGIGLLAQDVHILLAILGWQIHFKRRWVQTSSTVGFVLRRFWDKHQRLRVSLFVQEFTVGSEHRTSQRWENGYPKDNFILDLRTRTSGWRATNLL